MSALPLPPLPRKRWLALLALPALGALWFSRPAAVLPPHETVAAAPFTVAIKGVGDLVPRERHMIAAPFTAKLDTLAVEGKEVKAGEVVATLNTQSIEEGREEEELRQATFAKDAELRTVTVQRDRKKLETERRSARDNLALKQLELKQLLAGVPAPERVRLGLTATAAQRSFDTAEQEFKAQEELLAKGVIRPLDLDKTKVALAQARRAREVAATALAIANNGYPKAQLAVARLEVEKARNSLKLVEGKLANLVRTSKLEAAVADAERDWSKARLQMHQHRVIAAKLKAPSAGVVVLNALWRSGGRKKLQVGDDARENQAFMEIADVSRIFIKTEVKEVDIGRVHVGMPARIKVATLNKTFDGKLIKLGVLAYEKPDVVNREGAPKVFEGLIATEERNSAFRPGMSVDVELVVETLPAAITVPNRALATRNGQTTVQVLGVAEPRKVELGARGEERTVIKSGLQVGERVLVEEP